MSETDKTPNFCNECPDPHFLPCLACYTRAGYAVDTYERFAEGARAQLAAKTVPTVPPPVAAEAELEPAAPPPDTRLPHEIDPAHVYDTAAWPTVRTIVEQVTDPVTGEVSTTTREEPATYIHEDGRVEPHPWQITTRSV